MDAYGLVLNAGSSSLKFCVYQIADAAAWRMEARGQIEGIGTGPGHSSPTPGDVCSSRSST